MYSDLLLQHYIFKNHVTPSLIILPTANCDALVEETLTSDKSQQNTKCLQSNSVIYSWQFISHEYVQINKGVGCFRQ